MHQARRQSLGAVGLRVLLVLGFFALLAMLALNFIYIGPNPAPRDFDAEHRAAALQVWRLEREPAVNGWGDLRAALAAYDQAKTSVFGEDRVRAAEVVQAVTDGEADHQMQAEFSALMDGAERSGYGAALDRLCEAGWVVSPTVEDPISDTAIEAQGERRALVRLLAAEVADARARGDQDAVVLAVRRLLAVARAQSANASVICYLTELAATALACNQIHTTLTGGALDERRLRELHETLTGYEPAPVAGVFACEKALTLRMLWGQTRPGPVPKIISRAVQVKRAESLFDTAIRAAEATGDERGALLALIPESGSASMSTMFADMSVEALPMVMRVADLAGLELAATKLHIGIELYHARHGFYPERLDDLGSEMFAESPTDPRGLGGIVYRRIDDPAAREGLGFLLYAVGYDGIDDGGNHIPDDDIGKVCSEPGAPGYDYVFNRSSKPVASGE